MSLGRRHEETREEFAAQWKRLEGRYKPTYKQLVAENEHLTELAAKYWVLRDIISYHIKARKRVPKGIRIFFEAQMKEIDADIMKGRN